MIAEDHPALYLRGPRVVFGNPWNLFPPVARGRGGHGEISLVGIDLSSCIPSSRGSAGGKSDENTCVVGEIGALGTGHTTCCSVSPHWQTQPSALHALTLVGKLLEDVCRSVLERVSRWQATVFCLGVVLLFPKQLTASQFNGKNRQRALLPQFRFIGCIGVKTGSLTLHC